MYFKISHETENEAILHIFFEDGDFKSYEKEHGIDNMASYLEGALNGIYWNEFFLRYEDRTHMFGRALFEYPQFGDLNETLTDWYYIKCTHAKKFWENMI